MHVGAMELLQYLAVLRDADALSTSLAGSVLRSLRTRYQTKVLVATLVSVWASGRPILEEGNDAIHPHPSGTLSI
jgi:hypothetical protein